MKNSNQKNKIIKVPQDMLIDILAILLKEELNFEIPEVLENCASAVIANEIESDKPRQNKVIQNIQSLLASYNEFRFSENETLNWREN